MCKAIISNTPDKQVPPCKIGIAGITALFLLASLSLSAHAQNPSEHALDATPSYVDSKEQAVIITIEDSALRIPHEVSLVKFSVPSQAQGSRESLFNASEEVEAVRFFAKKRTNGKLSPAYTENADIPVKQVEGHSLTPQERAEYFDIESAGLQELWSRFRPQRIQRINNPPFNPYVTHVRTGERIPVDDDGSNHYIVILRDAAQVKPFVEAALQVPGVVDADPEPVLEDFGSTQ